MASRQDQVLDAAIRVLGTGGTRQLTHRAVDAAAGLPLGSTSNLFRTREALMSGVLRQVLQRETEAWRRIELTPDNFAEVVGAFVRDLAGPHRTLTVARKAVFLEAALHPELRKQVALGQRELATWAAPLLEQLGQQADLGLILSFVDGLLSAQLANPADDFDPTAAIAVLLRGMLAQPQSREKGAA